MFKITPKVLCAALAVLLTLSTTCVGEEIKSEHAIVSYTGIDKAYAQAIGRIVSTPATRRSRNSHSTCLMSFALK